MWQFMAAFVTKVVPANCIDLVTKGQFRSKVNNPLKYNWCCSTYLSHSKLGHWNAPFMLITMGQIPALYLIASPRYLA